MNIDQQQFIKLLFNADESVCVGSHMQSWNVISRAAALEQVNQLISVNPLDPIKDSKPRKDWHRADLPRRADHNVTALRNFVFEFDGDTLEEQAEILRSRQVPYATLTYSGGKSLHAVIALSEALTTEEEYRELFKTIRYVLWTTDKSCVNPSRLTRMPGVLRTDKNKMQELVDIRRRISMFELNRWLNRFSAQIERGRAWDLERQLANKVASEDVSTNAALNQRTLEFLEGHWNGKGSRHNRLLAITHTLFDTGVAYDAALTLITNGFINLKIGRDITEAQDIVNHVYFGG